MDKVSSSFIIVLLSVFYLSRLCSLKMDCTALQKLQEIAQLCDASDRPSFDAYRTDQKPMLERKIRMIYCPDTVPSIEQQGDATAIRFGTGEPKMVT